MATENNVKVESSLDASDDAGSRPSIETGLRLQAVGSLVLRYGLVLVVGWIGLMKFTEYEANGIQPMVAHSPLNELDVWVFDRTGVFKCTRCGRAGDRDFDWHSTLVSEGVRAW